MYKTHNLGHMYVQKELEEAVLTDTSWDFK